MNIPIIGKLIDGVSNYMTKRQEIKDNKIRREHELAEARHKAEVDRITRADNAEQNYDLIAQENAKNSYADEVLMFWTLTVVTALFFESTQEPVIRGFIALKEHTPWWFQLAFVGIFIAKFGLRFLFAKHLNRFN